MDDGAKMEVKPDPEPEVQVYDGDGRDRETEYHREVKRRRETLEGLDKEIDYRKAIIAKEQPVGGPSCEAVKATDYTPKPVLIMRWSRLLLFRLISMAAVVAMFSTVLATIFLAQRQSVGACMVFVACFVCSYLTLSAVQQWRID